MINRNEITENVSTEVKTYANWNCELEKYLQVGDMVDEEMVDYAVGVLPPATCNGSMVQMGEPYSHHEDTTTGKWRATWSTFVKTEIGWVYAGHCFKGEHININ